MHIEKRLEELGIVLPSPRDAAANYLLGNISGDMLYMSGQGPRNAEGVVSTGKVGAEVSLEQGYADARQTGINMLAALRLMLGDLDRVVKVVKVFGMVNSAPGFSGHPKVINGFSDLMVEVFGDAGRHARSAVGLAALPGDMTVEVEMIVQIRPTA